MVVRQMAVGLALGLGCTVVAASEQGDVAGWTRRQAECLSSRAVEQASEGSAIPDRRFSDLPCRLPADAFSDRTILLLGRDVGESGPDPGIPADLVGCMRDALVEADRVGPKVYLRDYLAAPGRSHWSISDAEVRESYRRVLHHARDVCTAAAARVGAWRWLAPTAAVLVMFAGGALLATRRRGPRPPSPALPRAVRPGDVRGWFEVLHREGVAGSAVSGLLLLPDRISLVAPGLAAGGVSASYEGLTARLIATSRDECAIEIVPQTPSSALAGVWVLRDVIDLARLVGLLTAAGVRLEYRR